MGILLEVSSWEVGFVIFAVAFCIITRVSTFAALHPVKGRRHSMSASVEKRKEERRKWEMGKVHIQQAVVILWMHVGPVQVLSWETLLGIHEGVQLSCFLTEVEIFWIPCGKFTQAIHIPHVSTVLWNIKINHTGLTPWITHLTGQQHMLVKPTCLGAMALQELHSKKWFQGRSVPPEGNTWAPLQGCHQRNRQKMGPNYFTNVYKSKHRLLVGKLGL